IFVFRIKRSNNKLARAVSEKALLLQEVHHRVKNNMQMVSSVLDVQANFIEDKKSLDAIRKSQNRIHALALAHQNLYGDENYQSIRIQEYLKNILGLVKTEDIELDIQCPEFEFEMEKAQIIGFVLHELLLNSIEHGFKKEDVKKITIFIEKIGGKYTLIYKDNGAVLKGSAKSIENPGFGMTMIRSFVERSLSGKLSLNLSNGFEARITFK
ncbi:MAG: sensor histidine kinase, partial [Crocinitomicaceae bacterium]|nr:sensor histidine kinase [Crocinitomicaceae bacterium]